MIVTVAGGRHTYQLTAVIYPIGGAGNPVESAKVGCTLAVPPRAVRGRTGCAGRVARHPALIVNGIGAAYRTAERAEVYHVGAIPLRGVNDVIGVGGVTNHRASTIDSGGNGDRAAEAGKGGDCKGLREGACGVTRRQRDDYKSGSFGGATSIKARQIHAI